MRSKLAAFAVVLALAVPGFSQDPGLGGGREVTEQQKKICPELKTAVGRRKDQLLALFFDLDWQKAQQPATKKMVASLFDFSKEEDQALIERYATDKGPQHCANGLRAVIGASDGRAFVFVLKKYEKAVVDSKGRWIDSLQAAPWRETWAFLEKQLDDTTAVPNWKASQEAPPGYTHLRVCDYAYRTFGARLIDKPGGVALPAELKDGQISSMMAIADRDAAIATLKKWIATDKAMKPWVAKQPSALATLADEPAKKEARELFTRLGIAAE